MLSLCRNSFKFNRLLLNGPAKKHLTASFFSRATGAENDPGNGPNESSSQASKQTGKPESSQNEAKAKADSNEVLSPQDIETLVKKCGELEEKYDTMYDKYRRSLADMENLRRSAERRIGETKDYAVQGFCKDLLEVADVLDLALDSVEKNKENPKENFEGLKKGVEMTKEVLLKVFSKHGVVPVHPHGHEFDPNIHDAITLIPREHTKIKPGHIHQVMKVGYHLHKRPIRPAKVIVVQPEEN
ncbi:grpE domain-containing protein [Ditylenchus destructor]|nr:grpE domain-containing protein [Ditylenchus destructor]